MSYDDTLPDDLNKARHILGDVSNDDATELLTDDHIETLLATYSYNVAVALMAQGLAARSAQDYTSITLPSGLSVSGKKATDYWLGLVATMQAGGLEGTSAISFVDRTLGIPETAEEFSRL